MSAKLSVQNFGPLRKAEVELTPLLVFMGENNTGKTYFATVLHRILDAVADVSANRVGAPPPEELALLMDRWADEGRGPEQGSLPDFSSSLVLWAERYSRDVLSTYGHAVRTGIEYAFGLPYADLRRRTSSGKPAGPIAITATNEDPSWRVEISLSPGRAELADVWTETTPPDPREWLAKVWHSLPLDPPDEASRRQPHASSYRSLHEAFAGRPPGLFDDWPMTTIHLPAGRTGLMQSAQAVTSAVVRRSVQAGIRRSEVPALSGTVADFLSLLLALPEGPARLRTKPGHPARSGILAAVEELEEQIGVRITVKGGLSEPQITAKTAEGSFPLSQTSSMVSELAPIVLTVRQLLESGDSLVLDEPEAHLHPRLQKAMAGFFAMLLDEGIRVVITTHSDFLVTELNNLIRAGSLQPRPSIRADRVSALVFERDKRTGCVARPLDVDLVEGIDQTTFGDVVDDLYNETIRLTDAINESA